MLAVEDGKALRVSKYGLDCKKYNETYTSVTWETCTLRSWLNSTFLESAFTSEEAARVVTTTVANPANATYGTSGGNATSDRVFLLSIDEVEKYIDGTRTDPDSDCYILDGLCAPTPYTVAQGAWQAGAAGPCYWLLRSPGYSADCAAYVGNYGTVKSYGKYVNLSGPAVRPAVWVNL